jgi:hypothetical protein
LTGIDWQARNEEIMSLCRQGRYAQALLEAKKAFLVIAQALGSDHLSAATSLNTLALLYRTQAEYVQAEAFC